MQTIKLYEQSNKSISLIKKILFPHFLPKIPPQSLTLTHTKKRNPQK